MKKILLLLLCSLLLFQMTVFAEDSRYVDIINGDIATAQLDTETFRYVKDPYLNEQLLSVWIKVYNNGGYSINHYFFRIHNRKMMLLNRINHNANGQVVNEVTNKYDPASWSEISPESVCEAWYNSALKYSQDNDEKLQEEYKKRTGLNKNNRNVFSIFSDAFDIITNNF